MYGRDRRRAAPAASRRTAWVSVVALALAGCIDFVAPDLPELGAPAVLQARLRLEDGRTLNLDALLAPGLDERGLRRTLRLPLIRLQDVNLSPDSVLANGTHVYSARLEPQPAGNDAIILDGPDVDGVTAPPPRIEWRVVRSAGPDTVSVDTAGALILTLILPAAASAPEPDLRQWVVALTNEAGEAYTISANGAAPGRIVIPPQFVPSFAEGTVDVRFTELQSIQLRPAPGDYVGLITLDNTIRWTVRP